MPVENVKQTFLAMVNQRLPVGSAEEPPAISAANGGENWSDSSEKALKLQEPVWCDL